MTDPRRIARELYGLDATAEALPGELDLNFALTANGTRYVLKLQNGDLTLEDAVLEHLRDEPAVPRLAGPTQTLDGRTVRLLSWLEGEPWAARPGDRASLGRTVARVDRALRDFTHPDLHRPHRWNLKHVVDGLDHLPHQLIHNDANDYNVLVGADGQVSGLIDFGDVVFTARACGLAIAGAYAMLGCADPARAVTDVVRGYHEVTPLSVEELEVLWELMLARLRMSVDMAAKQSAEQPDNAYLLVSQGPVTELLARLEGEDGALAHFRFRDACGYEASPKARAVRQRLALADPHPVMDGDLASAPVLDLSEAMPPVDGLAIGRYDEQRAIYTAPEFQTPDGRWRTRHMAIDLFAPAGAPVYAPLDGVVERRENRNQLGDYGGLLVIRHDDFWTLHGHLDPESLADGEVRAGDMIARLGTPEVNGGWEPHLHLQLFTDLVGNLDGVALPEEADLFRSVCPDPNLLIGRPGGVDARGPRPDIAARRRTVMSRALSLAYAEPLHIVRGEGAYLFDAEGRRFLDLVNNVAHVGHCHPRVVEAGARQMALLNTNTRYLHASVVDYARRLAATLPDPLHVCFFVNSGSEANDLALRLARAHTGRDEVAVLDHAYHGHLSSTIELSPYKAPPSRSRVTPLWELPEVDRPAAFFAEPILGCAGQVVPPPGYLERAFEVVREAGGLCVIDEVQTGFGRVGEHFWAFELGGVVPDIVTMGKPIGNGHPLGAVVTTPEVADSFLTGMEYFNTFGGNPVSAGIGLAVLDVIADERLQAHARAMGDRLLAGMPHARGHGLFLGVQLDSRAEAARVKEALKARGILISTDGPNEDVLKIKPPLAISAEDCDFFLSALADVL
ncbi:aminotransferase class III-fold pyridoxal phosphate-dependent enzyme [Solirubrobacter deserti]|uniref:Aminotransferase class III-fold pyridoxal phosphate-dependent enzyme n=1 Tax=Solirubrobacter deserti TaxID=2282478 RepID=A0ABT4RDS9_9ACTN|nr:aminotransferase class III-fold pyridoxal phosphate-dependent enzyme [Solirubrobacter deserti]MDA0136688.1 aminotransferase class III-fold pyridoxal phosphate-dependent enzyme [Solirubrobacter deserti]